ncbi:MAG: hypothetical protein GQ574_04835 [Crocinitomix sp.]|nr:hypothetical protein [Crocinitomix sp.]
MRNLLLTISLLSMNFSYGQDHVKTIVVGSNDSSATQTIKMNSDEYLVITKMDSSTNVSFRQIEPLEDNILVLLGGFGDNQVSMNANNNIAMLVNLPIFLTSRRYILLIDTPIGKFVEIDILK